MLTPEQRAAIERYTGPYHAFLNAVMRGEEPSTPDVMSVARLLDEAMADSQLIDPIVVYRGIGGDAAALLRASGLSRGSVLQDSAFASCSADPVEAGLFASRPPGGLILKISIPATGHALNVAPYSAYPDEQEYLLPRGTRLSVLGVDAAQVVVDVEVVI